MPYLNDFENRQKLDVGFANRDYNSMRYVGWASSIIGNGGYAQIFQPATLKLIQDKITEILMGLDKTGRPIIVPINTIASVLTQCLNDNSPLVGDIYTRYTFDMISEDRNDPRDIIDRAINIITSYIRTEYQMIEYNNSLTVWNSLYGDLNSQGLRAHPIIKIRKRRPQPMFFAMRY